MSSINLVFIITMDLFFFFLWRVLENSFDHLMEFFILFSCSSKIIWSNRNFLSVFSQDKSSISWGVLWCFSHVENLFGLRKKNVTTNQITRLFRFVYEWRIAIPPILFAIFQKFIWNMHIDILFYFILLVF